MHAPRTRSAVPACTAAMAVMTPPRLLLALQLHHAPRLLLAPQLHHAPRLHHAPQLHHAPPHLTPRTTTFVARAPSHLTLRAVGSSVASLDMHAPRTRSAVPACTAAMAVMTPPRLRLAPRLLLAPQLLPVPPHLTPRTTTFAGLDQSPLTTPGVPSSAVKAAMPAHAMLSAVPACTAAMAQLMLLRRHHLVPQLRQLHRRLPALPHRLPHRLLHRQLPALPHRLPHRQRQRHALQQRPVATL